MIQRDNHMKVNCDGCDKNIIGNYHATFKLPKRDIVFCEFCIEQEPIHYKADWQKKPSVIPHKQNEVDKHDV